MNQTALRKEMSEILAYTNEPVVIRFAEKEEISLDESRELFTDMLRFLGMCAHQDGLFAPPERIDDAWHNFLLFTKDYNEFCKEHFGRFLHHVPHVGPRNGPPLLPDTLKEAEKLFGPLSRHWQSKAEWCKDCSPSTNCQGCSKDW